MANERFYSFLGLCQRADQVVSGEVAVNMEIKRGKMKLIIIAEDVSANTREKYVHQSEKNKIPILILGNKEQLGSAIGKGYRALIGIKDKNMAVNLMKIYKNK